MQGSSAGTMFCTTQAYAQKQMALQLWTQQTATQTTTVYEPLAHSRGVCLRLQSGALTCRRDCSTAASGAAPAATCTQASTHSIRCSCFTAALKHSWSMPAMCLAKWADSAWQAVG